MPSWPDSPGDVTENEAYGYRLARIEKDLDLKADKDDLQRIADDVAAVRRLLTGLLVSIVGFAIGALFLVAQLNASP